MAVQQCVGALSTLTRQLSKADKRLAKKLEQFDVLPENAFVDNKVVCAVCDRSPSSIQRDVRAGRLAPPVKIGPNAVRWRVGAVRQFLDGVK
jgi:predicted DNA-binding transcriptional regulator AlpA